MPERTEAYFGGPTDTMKLFSFFVTAITSFAVINAATLPLQPHSNITNAPHSLNLTSDGPTCDITHANLPEFQVDGQANLFWTFCITLPITPLPTREVAALIADLINQFHAYLPSRFELNKYRYRHSRRMEIGIGPSVIGDGPHERRDARWMITNAVAVKVLSQLGRLVQMQMEAHVFGLEVYVYEKDTLDRRSRGTVAYATLERRLIDVTVL